MAFGWADALGFGAALGATTLGLAEAATLALAGVVGDLAVIALEGVIELAFSVKILAALGVAVVVQRQPSGNKA